MFNNLIDNIYIINLKSSKDRKIHMINEFKKAGIDKYEFFEAIDKDSDEVSKLIKTPFVMKYPPCFRCYKIQCNCDNNILIKNQIGNWCSFINIMKKIVDNNYKKLVMICEDDLKIKDNGIFILNKMINNQNFKKYNINLNKPLLIRCEQRSKILPLNQLKFTKKIVMSNACFLINIHYAKSFLKNLKFIDRTSDMYIQRNILKMDNSIQHFTIEPAPTHQLSDNKHAIFTSEIHPKGINKLDRIKKRNHFQKVNPMNYKYISNYYFNVIGIRKSGNHFISQNLLSTFKNIIYYNDVNLNKFNINNIKINKNLDKRIQQKIITKPTKFLDCVLVGIEDYDINNIKYSNKIYASYKFNILIIRNFFDVVLSRQLLNQKRKSNLTLVDDVFCKKYKNYCKEYLSETNIIKDKVCINYDFLINKNEEHINSIKKELNNRFTLIDYNSSFGRNDKTRDSLKVKYNKLSEENKIIFNQIIKNNTDIVNYNKQIFGENYINSKLEELNII